MIRRPKYLSKKQIKYLHAHADKVDGTIQVYAGTRTSKTGASLMIRTNVHLTEQLLAKLRKLSKATGLSVAELIRRACDSYLKGSS